MEYNDEQVIVGNLQLINHIRDTESLTSSTKLVAICLASRRNSNSLFCGPSYDTIHKDTGLSRPTISKAIKELSDSGVLFVAKKKVKFSRPRNVYFFLFDIEYQNSLIHSNYGSVREDVEELFPHWLVN